ncbi:MAG: 50S ribosomal protein L4 [Vampirovibrionales bacterium]
MSLVAERFNQTGQTEGQVELNASVFGITPNEHLLYLAVRRELVNAMAGTASTKTRGEVRGGGKKPWKQKGTGRARAGSNRSPLWIGGGVTFGPKPHSHNIGMNKKERRLAMISALSANVAKIKLVQDFSFLTAPKTKEVATLLAGMGADSSKRVLLVADLYEDVNQHLYFAARNLPNVRMVFPDELTVHDIMSANVLVFAQDALTELQERLVGSNG